MIEYEADDGPLKETDFASVRAAARRRLPGGKVVLRRVLEAGAELGDADLGQVQTLAELLAAFDPARHGGEVLPELDTVVS